MIANADVERIEKLYEEAGSDGVLKEYRRPSQGELSLGLKLLILRAAGCSISDACGELGLKSDRATILVRRFRSAARSVAELSDRELSVSQLSLGGMIDDRLREIFDKAHISDLVRLREYGRARFYSIALGSYSATAQRYWMVIIDALMSEVGVNFCEDANATPYTLVKGEPLNDSQIRYLFQEATLPDAYRKNYRDGDWRLEVFGISRPLWGHVVQCDEIQLSDPWYIGRVAAKRISNLLAYHRLGFGIKLPDAVQDELSKRTDKIRQEEKQLEAELKERQRNQERVEALERRQEVEDFRRAIARDNLPVNRSTLCIMDIYERSYHGKQTLDMGAVWQFIETFAEALTDAGARGYQYDKEADDPGSLEWPTVRYDPEACTSEYPHIKHGDDDFGGGWFYWSGRGCLKFICRWLSKQKDLKSLKRIRDSLRLQGVPLKWIELVESFLVKSEFLGAVRGTLATHLEPMVFFWSLVQDRRGTGPYILRI